MNGRPGNLAPIGRGTFDRETGRLAIEGTADRPDTGEPAAFTVEGRLAAAWNSSYRFGDSRAPSAQARRTDGCGCGVASTRPRRGPCDARADCDPDRSLAARPAAAVEGAERATPPVSRRVALGADVSRRDRRGHSPADALHVKTWADTYPMVRRPPTFAIRESQWKEAFAKADGSWFCIVIESAAGELVGFAKGVRTGPSWGDLNKIYLLRSTSAWDWAGGWLDTWWALPGRGNHGHDVVGGRGQSVLPLLPGDWRGAPA